MAKKRVHEIAKAHDLASKDVLDKLRAAGIEVKTASSSVDEGDAARALGLSNGKAPTAKAPAPKTSTAKPAAAKPKTPAAKAAAPAAPAATEAPAAPEATGAPAASAAAPAATAAAAAAPPADGGPIQPAPGAPRVLKRPVAPRADGLVPGTGPKIIAQAPTPAKKDEKARPTRGGVTGERGAGAAAPGGRRRVVIDSQASRRAPGTGGPMQQPPRRQRRGRRRRGTYDDTVQPLDAEALTTTDEIKVNSGSTVKDVAEYLGVPVPDIIKKLMVLGEMATLTQTLTDDAIGVIAAEFDKEVIIVHVGDEADADPIFEDDDADLVYRPPVVTIMGHVDHGKTSLLDAMREADVVAGEAGGITQHIGAYQVHHAGKVITFLDTPGHEAFTAMRARGAKVTDIAVIVVAADDGAKPQTNEAIDHARAAGVPMIVAVNKIDKEGADPTRVRTELTQRDLQPAEWGGETEYVDVSAKTHEGLDSLLDTIQVVAELQELTANPDTDASGFVIESKLDPGRGPVVTVLVQRGTLRIGDALVAGPQWGKVKAMHDYTGARVQEAFPGDPVEVLGYNGVPDAGEFVHVVPSEKDARRQAAERENRLKTEALARKSGRKVSFEEVFRLAQEGSAKELNLVLKADVSGSLEAFEDEIAKLPQDEITVNIIRSGVGGINESDVMLATASDAVILGFNVRPVGDARAAADREAVEIRSYSIIYKALDDLRDAMTGMLEPEEVEEEVGRIEIRTTFRASKIGVIAGCYVLEGKVTRGAKARLVRDGTVVYDGRVSTLRRFNDDAREVQAGYECGITLENFQDVKEGDIVEAYATKQVERALS